MAAIDMKLYSEQGCVIKCIVNIYALGNPGKIVSTSPVVPLENKLLLVNSGI